MTIDELTEQLRERVTFEVPPNLNPYDNLTELGFDSLHVVEFLAATEEMSGAVQLPSVDVAPTTLADLLDYYWCCVRGDRAPSSGRDERSDQIAANGADSGMSDSVYSEAISQKHRLVRPVFPSDYHNIYLLALEAGPTWQWRSTGPSPSALEESLWADVLLQYVLLGANGEFGGVAAIEHANLAHGWANIRVHVVPACRNSGSVLRGVAVLIEEAFENHGLHNIYAISAGEDFLIGAESTVFEREATFKGKLQVGQSRMDQVVRTLSYERWQDLRQRVSTWLP